MMMPSVHMPKILSGSWLKVIALLAMTLDHLAAFVLKDNPLFTAELFTFLQTPVTGYRILRDIGRIAFPIFAFLITEGYRYTRDRRRYALSLAALAIVSEIPYNLAKAGTVSYPPVQNIFFTLLLGYLAICCWERFKESPIIAWTSVIYIMIIASVIGADYGYGGIAMILLLHFLGDKKVTAGLVSCFLVPNPLFAAMSFVFIGMYDGKRGFIRKAWMKYAFYAYYPIHLIILYLVNICSSC